MTHFQAAGLAALLGPMLLVGACTSSGVGRSAQGLGQRLQTQLAPDLAGGRVALEQLPDGAQVTLTDQSLFPNGGAELDDKGRYVLASVIEGLLEPRITRIEVVGSSEGYAGLQAARTRAVAQYFEDYGLGPTLVPTATQQETPPGSAGSAPQGQTITVRIVSS
jgi:chemotaxis protein MotB